MKLVTLARMLYLGLVRDREEYRYSLAERISRMIYPKYKFSEFGRAFLEDREFLAIYERFCDPGNYHSLDRKYALASLLGLVRNLPGDSAECGVYNGASSYLMCRALSGSGKRHCIFDSFEGLSDPGPSDGTYWSSGALRIDESVVRANLSEFDFVDYYKGWIPERFDQVAEREFCFVHIDVDLYEPTRDSLAFFYPRCVSRAVILCDDYGFVTCPGARTAMDEFFSQKPERIVELPTGQGFVVKA